MLRIIKTLLAAAVGVFGLLGGILDIVNWKDTVVAIAAVTSMTTWAAGAESWQAISSTPLNWLGATWIVALDLAYGTLCLVGALQMWNARSHNALEFAAAKRLALAGCGLAALMLFGGFIVVAETFFELWRSDAMRGVVLDSAYRYLGSILLIALFIAGRESD